MSQISADQDLIIFEAEAKHIPLLRDLGAQTFREAYQNDADANNMDLYIKDTFTIANIEVDFYNPETKYLLAQFQGTWAAYVLLRWDHTHETVEGTKALRLHRIYVVQKFWRHKIGSRLMTYIIDFARLQGYEYLWLVVWNENPKAIQFYQRWGFEHAGYQKFEFGNEVTNDWVMRKKLH